MLYAPLQVKAHFNAIALPAELKHLATLAGLEPATHGLAVFFAVCALMEEIIASCRHLCRLKAMQKIVLY